MSDKYLKYVDDVKKHAKNYDEAIVKKIVGFLGIALRNRDSANVSCTDDKELGRVRDGFCKKRLGLNPDQADKAVTAACEAMKGVNSKSRVTFYYLVAEASGTLGKLK